MRSVTTITRYRLCRYRALCRHTPRSTRQVEISLYNCFHLIEEFVGLQLTNSSPFPAFSAFSEAGRGSTARMSSTACETNCRVRESANFKSLSFSRIPERLAFNSRTDHFPGKRVGVDLQSPADVLRDPLSRKQIGNSPVPTRRELTAKAVAPRSLQTVLDQRRTNSGGNPTPSTAFLNTSERQYRLNIGLAGWRVFSGNWRHA